MTPTARHQAQWRMAASEGALARRNFITLGLPPPNVVIMKEYGNASADSEGGQLRRGHCQLQLGWESMTQRQAEVLRAEIEAGQAAGGLYLTIDRATGQAPGPDWVDVFGFPLLPEWETLSKSLQQVYERVGMQMIGVTVINAPSDYAGE